MNIAHRHSYIYAVILLLIICTAACKQSVPSFLKNDKKATLADVDSSFFNEGDFAKTFDLADSALHNDRQKPGGQQKADLYLWMASSKIVQGRYAEAGTYLNNAKAILNKTKNDSLAAIIYLISGELHAEKIQSDSAEYCFAQGEKLAGAITNKIPQYQLTLSRISFYEHFQQSGPLDSLTKALIQSPGIQTYRNGYYYQLALASRIQYFNDNGSPDSALRLSEQLTTGINNKFPNNLYLKTILYRSLSQSTLNNMDYGATVRYAKQETAFAHQCHSARALFDAYQDVMESYTINQDFKNVISYADSVDRVREAAFPERSIEASILYKLYTRIFSNTHDYGKARYYAEKGIALDRTIYGERSEGIASDYTLIGNLYSYENKFDSMLNYSLKALQIRKMIYPKDHLKIGFSLDDIARTYNNMDKPLQALPLQKEVEHIYKKNYGPLHSYVAWAYDAEADSYQQLHQYDKAIQYNNAAFGVFIPNMDTDTGALNKTLSIPFDIYIPDYFNSRLLLYLNRTLHTADTSLQIKYLKEGYRISQATSKYIQSYAARYDSPESVAVLYQRMYDAYKISADVCYRLYKLTGDPKYRQGILDFSENKRGAFLRSSVLGNRSIQFSGIPKDVIKRESQLRNEVTAAADKTFPAAKRDSINGVYGQFLHGLSEKYTNYYRLKYLPYELSEKQVQQWLPDAQTAFAEYLVSKEQVYIYIITKNKCSIVGIAKKDSLIDQVSGLNNLLKKNDLKDYYNTGYSIYNYLAKPLEQYIAAGSKIIVSADGPLSTLSFEALPTKPQPSPGGINAADFLLNKYNFSYAVSAFSLVNPFDKQDSIKKKSRAFFTAPGFDNNLKNDYHRFAVNNQLPVDNNYMSYLYQPFMLKLGDDLSKAWRVTREEGSDATESNFKAKAAGNNIVQIGSHAILNDIDPMRSCLVFAKELSPGKNTNDGYLYSSEIYNQRINADLVILTACETGVGQFKEGEGMMSLSYGFEYAGCKSAIMSLWPIDEKTASVITENFYKHLAAGESTSDALYHAKKDFLSTADPGLANPFYWSGLVLLGQNEKIQLEKKADIGQYAWVLGIIAITALGAFGLKKWQKRSAA